MRMAYWEPNSWIVAHAVDAADRILHVGDHVVGNVGAGERAVVVETNADDHQEVGRRLGDGQALLLHRLRQQRHRELHLVLHLHLRDVGIGAASKVSVIVAEPAASSRR